MRKEIDTDSNAAMDVSRSFHFVIDDSSTLATRPSADIRHVRAKLIRSQVRSLVKFEQERPVANIRQAAKVGHQECQAQHAFVKAQRIRDSHALMFTGQGMLDSQYHRMRGSNIWTSA